MSVWGEPTAAWSTTSSTCGECSDVFDGCACPNCGEHADASATSVIGFVTGHDDSLWLTTVASHGAGWQTRGQRPLSDEQAHWLARQGDVR